MFDETIESAYIENQIDERIEVGNGSSVTNVGALNAQVDNAGCYPLHEETTLCCVD